MTGTGTCGVELYVRSLSPESVRGPAEDHLDRLRELANRGKIDLSVSVWGREVGLSTTAARTGAGKAVLDRVATFRAWADDHGVSVEPFFRTREVRSDLTGEAYEALVLPSACLAEYRSGDLVHVAPYANGSDVHSVADRVDRIVADAETHSRTTPPAEPARR